MSAHKTAIKDWCERNNELTLQQRREQYESDAADDPNIESFEDWLPDAGWLSMSEVPDGQTIAGVKALADRAITSSLMSFWEAGGLINGEASRQDLTIRILEPQKLVDVLSPDARPYEHLRGLGLFDWLNWCWGNHKSFLELREGYVLESEDGSVATYEELLSVNNSLTCFGVLMDGGCESHLVLHVDEQGDYGATYWHQDETVPMQADIAGFASPEALIMACLAGYDAILKAHEDDPYFSLFMLREYLKTGKVPDV